MNFFEQQDLTRRNSRILTMLFLFCALALCLGLGFIFSLGGTLGPEIFLMVSGGTLALILLASLYKIWRLSSESGIKIALGLGARYLSRDQMADDSPEVRRLLNVVEEMAIASGVPRPPVFLLEDRAINAFAAGLSYDNAIICVTRGTMELLTRDELQGVVAHEFSHILNGDMRLNVRAIGLLHGMMCIGLIGRELMGAKDVRASLPGMVIWVVGSIGLFMGNLVKVALNRQREFLADASSAQFTRYPQGLANALKKIGGMGGAALSAPGAAEFSHLYFANGLNRGLFRSFLDTHPPLDKRILALEPRWNGRFIPPELRPVEVSLQPAEQQLDTASRQAKTLVKGVTVAAILHELNNIGTISDQGLQQAQETIAEIPSSLREAVDAPLAAQTMVFALLLDPDDETIRADQLALVRKFFLESHPELTPEFLKGIMAEVRALPRPLVLPLIQLVLPTLKIMTTEEYRNFRSLVARLIVADKRVTWFELNLRYLVLYPLDLTFGLKKIPVETHSVIGEVRQELGVILSAIAYEQFHDDGEAEAVFQAMAKASGLPVLRYVPAVEISPATLENAYQAVQKAKPVLRHRMVGMAVLCLKMDEGVSSEGLETLHAFCTALHLPINLKSLSASARAA